MKIVFTSFYKTYFKDNTRKKLYCKLLYFSFLNKCDFFFLLIIWDGVSINYKIYWREYFVYKLEINIYFFQGPLARFEL